MSECAKQVAALLRRVLPSSFTPKVALISGSGLGSIAEKIENPIIIPYSELPNFCVSGVTGHGSKLHFGMLQGIPVAFLEGRLHMYEGADSKAQGILRTMIRTVKLLGCETMLSTNAVGSLRPEYGPGSLMVIKDHINFMFGNPLVGKNDDEFGDRHISMDQAYDPKLRAMMMDIVKKQNIPAFEGVLIAIMGPTFETPAEIRMFKTLGADATGMSTVSDTIIARHCGLRVIAISVITNFAAGMSDEILSHEGTLKGAQMGIGNLEKLMLTFLAELKNKI